jgi:hypothetical protein
MEKRSITRTQYREAQYGRLIKASTTRTNPYSRPDRIKFISPYPFAKRPVGLKVSTIKRMI